MEEGECDKIAYWGKPRNSQSG